MEEHFNFTHRVAVHEEDAKGSPTVVFQAEKERIVSVEVVGSLRGEKDENLSFSHFCTHSYQSSLLHHQDLLTPFGKPSLVKMGQVLQLVSWRYCLCTCSPRP